jgi:16S rRNA (cytosine1402-N4)-methyltransferase
MTHIPVMYEECLEALNLKPRGIFVDGTLGGGGHAEGILKNERTRLIGIDKDIDAIKRCEERFQPYKGRFTLVNDDFKNIKEILEGIGIEKIDGALLDLGVSSFQLEQIERGFSYSKNAPLDMRMDKSARLSARDVVNDYDEAGLRKVIFEYGEEKFAGRIVSAIIRNRPVNTTEQLSEIIRNAVPAAKRRTGGHPAKRTFQAIRIEVNSELKGLREAIDDYISLLKPTARLAVITFHSLEDRIVKQAFRHAQNPCECPPDFPKCVCGKTPLGRCVPKKPIVPAKTEIERNPRAHSAKLRVFEKDAPEMI